MVVVFFRSDDIILPDARKDKTRHTDRRRYVHHGKVLISHPSCFISSSLGRTSTRSQNTTHLTSRDCTHTQDDRAEYIFISNTYTHFTSKTDEATKVHPESVYARTHARTRVMVEKIGGIFVSGRACMFLGRNDPFFLLLTISILKQKACRKLALTSTSLFETHDPFSNEENERQTTRTHTY